MLTLIALASLIGGYYAGQYWQRLPLADLSAVVYPAGRPLDDPAGLIGATAPPAPWRLLLAADTRAPQCHELLRHYASVINRLAAWPQVQARLRLTLLAYDGPDARAITAFSGDAGWVEVVSAPAAQLDHIAGQLGILPVADEWCTSQQANSILVAPDGKAWALIPFEQTTIMANNIRTTIAFVE